MIDSRNGVKHRVRSMRDQRATVSNVAAESHSHAFK